MVREVAEVAERTKMTVTVRRSEPADAEAICAVLRAALPFYRARGYQPDGEPMAGFGVTRGCPVAKTLRP